VFSPSVASRRSRSPPQFHNGPPMDMGVAYRTASILFEGENLEQPSRSNSATPGTSVWARRLKGILTRLIDLSPAVWDALGRGGILLQNFRVAWPTLLSAAHAWMADGGSYIVEGFNSDPRPSPAWTSHWLLARVPDAPMLLINNSTVSLIPGKSAELQGLNR